MATDFVRRRRSDHPLAHNHSSDETVTPPQAPPPPSERRTSHPFIFLPTPPPPLRARIQRTESNLMDRSSRPASPGGLGYAPRRGHYAQHQLHGGSAQTSPGGSPTASSPVHRHPQSRLLGGAGPRPQRGGAGRWAAAHKIGERVLAAVCPGMGKGREK
jgi:hypothetical protein